MTDTTQQQPSDLPPPRAVLFDWDNTLVDNWASIHDALNVTLAAMGHEPWTKDEVKARVRASARDSFPKMFGARWEEAAEIFYSRFATAHLETLQTLSGADALIRSLAAGPLYIGVVSNKHGDLLRKEAAALGWTSLFGRIVGADDAQADKPAPDPIFLALRDSDIPAGRHVWYVGDAAIDLECAVKAGCVAVLIGEGHGEAGEARADLRFRNCEDLANALIAP